MFIDTHTHLYLEEFNADRPLTIKKAIESGVSKFLLPNIDSSSWLPMLDLARQFPDHCFPMAGLHPTSVTLENMEKELLQVEDALSKGGFCAIGEIGIDLYWDKTYKSEQDDAFRTQLQWAKKFHLPVAIHMRNSFNEVWAVVQKELAPDLKGVFHCFSGNIEQARLITEAGFTLGIGGVITFKNSGLQEVVKEIGLDHLILETDAPYLAPVPFRGKRNEPSYIPIIASKIAEITGNTLQEVADVTTGNARKLFKLPLV
ncbi:MAG: TatD family hydrolase [Bacteroidales bacterium]|nr:TatD family hydrolase [Bacteroidales bacterium]